MADSLTGDYELDLAHTRIAFAVKHAMVSNVRGSFTAYSGTVHLDEEDVTNSSATLEIDAASVDTGNNDRDTHVRAGDFLDVENHPTLRFVSTSATHKGDDDFELVGDLTIRDTTRSVTIGFEKQGAATDPWGGFRVGFEGTTTISRKDFGLSFNVPLDGGGVLVGDKIKLEFDIEAVKKA